MGKLIGGFLDNDSTFGRIMTKCWIVIGANLMFVIFSLPVITIGPALAALFYVMLKSLHTDNALNPVRTFWTGFKMNFRQGILCFLGIAAAAVILVLDIRFCIYQGGVLEVFKYACFALLFFLAVETIYLMPVMAAFDDTIPHLLRNALFFASRRPLKMLLAAAICIVPAVVTVVDTHMRPLYGFLWTVCGFGLIAMMISELLIGDLEKYLPADETGEDAAMTGNSAAGRNTPSKRKILKEMKKLDES